jgi:hypothetical protein
MYGQSGCFAIEKTGEQMLCAAKYDGPKQDGTAKAVERAHPIDESCFQRQDSQGCEYGSGGQLGA